ncbi:MAG: TonB-dependent receptor [Vicinamibacteria bacterium]|nr:TonB-dependent receptor [Vicinamibacteria bacterium]
MTKHSAVTDRRPGLLAALLALATLPLLAFAQSSVEVSGAVRDAVTGKAVAGATVSAGTRMSSTDAAGRFRLDLPQGNVLLIVEADGYLVATADVAAGPGGARVDVLLEGRLFEEVDVTAELAPEAERPATIPVRPAAVLQVAGGVDNVFRVLQTLPGVAGAEEFGSRLAVRGGGPDQNLTVMDGVEIHNPYRLFGLVAAFNPETVEGFELTAGAFSARYGDRLSSLLVVENRNGRRESGLNGSTALSVTDANVIVEGPVGAGSWLVTGRRTYYDLVAERFTESDLPGFSDLQARATFGDAIGPRLTLSGLLSREDADADFEGDTAGEEGAFVGETRNELFSATLDFTLSPRATGRTLLAYYRNAELLDVDARFQSEVRRSNAPDGSGFGFADVVFDRELSVRDVSLRQDFVWQAADRHLLEAGLEYHALDTVLAFANAGDTNPNEAVGSSVRGGAGLPDALDSGAASGRGGAWVQDRWDVSARLNLTAGLRASWSSLVGVAVEPRLSAVARLTPRLRLLGAAGYHTQSPGYEKLIQSDDLFDLGDADTLGFERSLQGVLGFEWDLAPGWMVRVEGWAKRFDDLLVGQLETDAEVAARLAGYDFPAEYASSLPSEPRVTSRPTQDGRGRAWGTDVFLSRRAAADDKLSGWLAYGYGHAEREAWGRTLPLDYDRRHSLSLVANWRPSRTIDVGATFRVASGFPYTPVTGLRVDAMPDAADADRDGNVAELVPMRDTAGRPVWTTDLGGIDNLNTAQLPTFARLDLRLSWRPRGERGRWQFYLDVINVLNRDNAGELEPSLVYQPGADRPAVVLTNSQSIPLLPSFGVRFRF